MARRWATVGWAVCAAMAAVLLWQAGTMGASPAENPTPPEAPAPTDAQTPDVPASQPSEDATNGNDSGPRPPGKVIETRASNGFTVQLVGIDYSGKRQLESDKGSFSMTLNLKVKAPKDSKGIRMAWTGWELATTSDESGQNLLPPKQPQPYKPVTLVGWSGSWGPTADLSTSISGQTRRPRILTNVRGRCTVLEAGAAVSKDQWPVDAGQMMLLAPGVTLKIEAVEHGNKRKKIKFSFTDTTHKMEGGQTKASVFLDKITFFDGVGGSMAVIDEWTKDVHTEKMADGVRVLSSVSVASPGNVMPRTMRVTLMTGVTEKVVEFGFEKIPVAELTDNPGR